MVALHNSRHLVAGKQSSKTWTMPLSTGALLLLTVWVIPTVPTAQSSAQSGTSDTAGPVFVDGEAQVVKAFKDSENWIQYDLWVEAEFDSDGDGKPDRMHVDVTRQAQTESEGLRVPVIYETSPYFSGTGSGDKSFFWDPEHELGSSPPVRTVLPPIPHQARRLPMSNSLINTWVPRGFAVVHSASPGTGKSQGCATVGGINESLAPKAVIDWLNGRARGFTTVDGDEEVSASWCTGKVGMTGTSYNGTLPLAAATTGVEGLEAIIPVSPNTSYYHYYRSNGLVRHPGGYMGEDIDVLYDFINSGNPDRRDFCNDNVRDQLMADGQDRVSGDYNDFWASRDYMNQLGPLKAATLMAHGFNDWNVMPAHSTRIYAAIKAKGVPAMAYFHQGGHGGPPPLPMMNRWFTRYLYGVENDVENGPRSWIVREDESRRKPTSYADYPHPGASPVQLFPQSGGRRRGELSDSAGKGSESLVDDVSESGTDLAKEQKSEHRLLYVTPELKQPLHISGTAKMHLRLSSSKPAANLSVWLVSLPWEEGRQIPQTHNIITRGWADPQNQSSLTESEPLVPGQFYDLTFDLQPDDQVIPAGQQIGLMIFSSDRDFTLWPEAGTELTIDLANSHLELPLVDGQQALANAFK
ncbi:MAG: X-Pro dipeptidyl-peptidase [Planctomycetota bacterium]|jgi:X-Pro dipeptidyl-peptidase